MVAVSFQQGQLLETILNHFEPFWIYSIYGRDPTSCDLSAALGVNDVPHRRIRNQLGPDASPQFHMEKSTPSLDGSQRSQNQTSCNILQPAHQISWHFLRTACLRFRPSIKAWTPASRRWQVFVAVNTSWRRGHCTQTHWPVDSF
jgi:hypothetical protein